MIRWCKRLWRRARVRVKLSQLCGRVKISQKERDAQRVSFAYGNTKLHNPDVTREMVAELAKLTKAVEDFDAEEPTRAPSKVDLATWIPTDKWGSANFK